MSRGRSATFKFEPSYNERAERPLAAVTSGEPVFRETALPGAVFTRVAASHIRVGTFQFLAAREDVGALRALADHAIGRHYPAAAEAAEPYVALLEAVVEAQAALVARWLGIKFETESMESVTGGSGTE